MSTAADVAWDTMHMGRSWKTHALEDGCPCPQEPCGLVAMDKVDPACPQHPIAAFKTIRQSHEAKDCPGVAD